MPEIDRVRFQREERSVSEDGGLQDPVREVGLGASSSRFWRSSSSLGDECFFFHRGFGDSSSSIVAVSFFTIRFDDMEKITTVSCVAPSSLQCAKYATSSH